MTYGNDSAAPIFLQNGLTHDSHVDFGLTKREYFAAMALQGIISAHRIYTDGIDNEVNARTAVNAADALISALNQTQTP